MRRKKKQGFEFWHIVILFLVAIYLYAWQKGVVFNQGYRIGEAEIRHKELLMENRQLDAQVLSLKSISAIRFRLQKFGLPLVEPKSWNIYQFDFKK
ncbi:MAG: hypothetical protein NTY10_07280 [Candidatus Omnitrophica bacterium]|nr:hypothetical protein [Candidatus Omnitrophota bacterium]